MSAAAQYAPAPQQASWAKFKRFKRCKACGRLFNHRDIREVDDIKLCLFCAVTFLSAFEPERDNNGSK